MAHATGEMRDRQDSPGEAPLKRLLQIVPPLPGRAEADIGRLLADAGIRVDGPNPWDVRIRDRRVFERVARGGTLAAGEAWMDGWWDCEQLDEMVARLLGPRQNADAQLAPWLAFARSLPAWILNRQGPRRARRAIARHYEAGNDLFEAMLDRRMIYSCAYWRDAADLDAAQEAKLALICDKLGIEKGMRVLDIGCGWGGLARFVAERHGAEVVGITLSPSQAELAERRCRGLPVEIRLQDYREVRGRFDRIVSVGMIEHVGPRNYRTFAKVVRRCLADDGLALIQTIGNNVSRTSTDPWLATYIFPDTVLPSIRQLGAAFEGLFVVEDWQNFGADYDRTLMAWHRNLEQAWPRLSRYGDRFRRMWRYYLLTCAATFRVRRNQLWQIVLSPRGVPGGWRAVR